ncbi:GNAT family N-acetyltransferase, partial [Parabacteroides goldsteinii]
SSSFGIPGYTIREAIYEDAEIIYEAIDKHREDLRIWLPFVDGLNSVADEQLFLESTLKVPYKERDVVYIIEKGFAICGLIGFHFSDRTNHRTEIGYWLLPEFRGKGVITRAVHYLCQWAFFEKDFNRIQVRCAVGNQPSNAIPQRLGFTLEGTERDGELLSSGEYTDINVYSLLRKELELK